MQEIDEVKIVFENVESITIKLENIRFISMNEIKESIVKVACNSIIGMKISESIILHISAEAKEKSQTGLYEDIGMQRIMEHCDIASFEMLYNNKVIDTIYPIWTGDDYTNDSQSVVQLKNGDIIIVVDKHNSNSSYDLYMKNNKLYEQIKK